MDDLPVQRELATERLVLEPLGVAHAGLLFPGFSDPALYRFLHSDAPADVAALEQRFAAITKAGAGAPERWLNWAMRLPAEEAYAGLIEVTLRPDASVNLAYFTFTPFTRRGLAREGCERVLDALRDDFGARSVVATMDIRNVASRRLVEALGFVRDDADEPSSLRGVATRDYRYRLALTGP